MSKTRMNSAGFVKKALTLMMLFHIIYGHLTVGSPVNYVWV